MFHHILRVAALVLRAADLVLRVAARVLRVAALAIFVCGAGRFSDAQEWPQFRGPDAQGNATAKNLPLHWDAETHVWKTRLPGTGWSSPVVANGRVYLTVAAAIGNAQVSSEGEYTKKVTTPFSLRTVCIDYQSGKILWDVETSQVPAETSIHPKNSHASATPIVTANRVFVHFGAYGTAALNLEGDIIWKEDIEYNPVHGSGGSLVLFEDLVIFNCDGRDDPFVLAVDAATGEERWRTPRPDVEGLKFSFSTPLLISVNGQAQLVSAGSHAACGYDPRTGKQQWVVHYPNKWSVVPRPVFAGGLVLICTGYEGPAELLAIRPDGKGDVTDTHVEWRVNKFVPHNPSPIVDDGTIYTVDDDGIAACRDLRSGKLHWKKRLGGNFSASPIMGEQRLYFLSEDGVCTVVKAAHEFQQLAKNELNERTFASIAALDGALLIRTENSLYRIGE